MRTIPTVGGAKGIFEIFIPGIFLLLNFCGAYLVLAHGSLCVNQTTLWISSPVVGIMSAIAFGYLLGVVLRTMPVGFADWWSAKLLSVWHWKTRKKGEESLFFTDSFPFARWLKARCRRKYPDDTNAFFDEVWAKGTEGGHGRVFFNFCKVMVMSEDEWTASEIYSAEALSRYIASTFWTLVVSFFLLLAIGIHRGFSFETESMSLLLYGLMALYLAGIVAILLTFRLIRLREVELVFALSFKSRAILFQSKGRD